MGAVGCIGGIRESGDRQRGITRYLYTNHNRIVGTTRYMDSFDDMESSRQLKLKLKRSLYS
jgi:hypothetical protein